MSFNEDNILLYLSDSWDETNATKPERFTKAATLLDYSNSVFVKRHKLPSAFVAANVKRTMEFYEFQLKCVNKNDIDELVRVLHLYPAKQPSFDFEESTEALAFAGWSRGPSPNGPTWSTTYAHGGTHSVKMKQDVIQSYCWNYDFDCGTIVSASTWVLVHAVGTENNHAWFFALHAGAAPPGTEIVAAQFFLAADRYIYYAFAKGVGGHSSGVQFALDTWFKLGMVLHDATKTVDYYVNDNFVGSHAYFNINAVTVDGLCVEGYSFSDGWEWYFDDVSVPAEDEYDRLPEKPQIDVEYLGQDIKGQHVWKANMYVVKYE